MWYLFYLETISIWDNNATHGKHDVDYTDDDTMLPMRLNQSSYFLLRRKVDLATRKFTVQIHGVGRHEESRRGKHPGPHHRCRSAIVFDHAFHLGQDLVHVSAPTRVLRVLVIQITFALG